MLTLTHTHTRTYTVTVFADPYKVCTVCGEHVCGVRDQPGPLVLVPCDHQAPYADTCPSWGPVDGCRCQQQLGEVPHLPAPECPRNHGPA